ncbi:N-methyl-L-tryptophan oxidase [Arthrobacter sp. MYb23]|uniref:N-methyl-L-tryptophan oxidase n=1 Tax=unclassified Arthrobacter TaxID=235627 RepID=UPI000CFDB6D8|nr:MULTISPECIES: N-methyl-L-tryptophan oxidase [unclassified Arthrobacter]PRB43361.1 N-methyl-L-tryptophan oxidase [Arthrobacter sp. MYb51]PRB96983.1 N-methyl-L-tryptophan oxidase [Arthrobacter sp. MYb23]
MDGKLAVIGLGSIGSMALWQASRLTDSVVGFEAHSPAHGRSAAGGDTRLFRMIYRGNPAYYPLLERSRELWAELEAETGQDILTRCGGLSIGTSDGPYIRSLLETTRLTGGTHQILSREEMASRYPQHNLRADDIAVYDPKAGALRTDRAITAAVTAAEANGATVNTNTPIDSITESDDGVVITSGANSWTFERVIVASGAWSKQLMPEYLKAHTETRRIFLSWFVARDAEQFSPEKFPIFIRISGDRSMYGAPAVDGVTVKATLDGRGAPTPAADSVPRDLTPAEITETTETVSEFFPGLVPSIVRSDAFPDLFTSDSQPLMGFFSESSRIYSATGFSGAGFKMAAGYGEIAATEALGKRLFEGFDFLRPQRFQES